MKTAEAAAKAAQTADLLVQDLRELTTALCSTQTPEQRIAWAYATELLTEAGTLKQKLQSLQQ